MVGDDLECDQGTLCIEGLLHLLAEDGPEERHVEGDAVQNGILGKYRYRHERPRSRRIGNLYIEMRAFV